MKCDKCSKQATIHLTEVRAGKHVEIHLCEQCANQAEIPMKSHNIPLNELLTNFVSAHSGTVKESGEGCPQCGLTWTEFRQGGLLGCEHDYGFFDKDLSPLLNRAHEGATHHLGKVPTRRGGTSVPAKRQLDVTRLKKELHRAIEAEDYERAAKLRDQIRQAEA